LDDDSEGAGESISLARFWKPRHWPAWALWLWMRLNAALPLRVALAIHRPIGKALYRLFPKMRRVVQRNLEICFPDLDSGAVETLAKRQFESLAMSIPECAAAWLGRRNVPSRFEIVGVEHLNAAVARGKGTLLYTGHFTPLDICGAAFKELVPLYAAMVSQRSSPVLNELQRRGRVRNSHEIIASDSVRSLLKFLKRNGVVWYAPDLAYREGALIPFFGEPAMTNTATSKIARMSGATVLPYQYRRITGARYEIHIYPPLDAFPSDDPVGDTRRLGAFLEQFIRDAPEQYQWIQKRFRWRPPEFPDPYAKRESR
jgi:KDO2-lipid IV(A) lauroyltransferase